MGDGASDAASSQLEHRRKIDLARNGVKVALLEKGLIGAEQSSRNWGWVRQQGRDRRELPLIVQSLAIWDELQNGHGLDLGFRRTGLLSLTRDAKELARWGARKA